METPRLRLAFGAQRRFSAALWPSDLARSPPALERRRIASLKAQDYAHFQSGITAGICGRRNGVQGSVCTAAILSRSVAKCPLCAKSRHLTTRGGPRRSESRGRLYQEIEAVLFKDRLRGLRTQEC